MTTSWRDLIKIHPACELLPPTTADELRALADDIKAHGLQTPVVFWCTGERCAEPPLQTLELLDGRSRLDAMEAAGLPVVLPDDRVQFILPSDGVDPWQFVLSANLMRRHLTREQKREVIDKLLQQRPELSDRAIAKLAGISDKTVGAVRRKVNAEIPHKEGTSTNSTACPGERREASGRKARGRKAQPRSAAAQTTTTALTTGCEGKIRRLQAIAQGRTIEHAALADVTVTPATKAERVVAADRVIDDLGLTPDDMIRHWIEQRERYRAAENQHGETEREPPTNKGQQMAAEMAQATEWLDGFCCKWGIEGTRRSDCYLDMAAYFGLLGHHRAVKLEDDELAKKREAVNRLTFYREFPAEMEDENAAEDADEPEQPDPPAVLKPKPRQRRRRQTEPKAERSWDR